MTLCVVRVMRSMHSDPDFVQSLRQHRRIFVLLIRIALVTVADLGRGGTAGGVDSAAFGTYRGPQRHCGGENFAVVLCSFVVGIGYMLLLMGAHPGSGSLRRYMGCRLKETISSEPS